MPNNFDLENKVLQELADALEMGGKGNDYQAQSKDRYNNCDRVNFKLKQEQQEVYNCWTAEMIGDSSVKEIRFSQHRGVLHKTRRRSWLEGICPCRWKQFVRRLSSGKPYSHLMIEDGLLFCLLQRPAEESFQWNRCGGCSQFRTISKSLHLNDRKTGRSDGKVILLYIWHRRDGSRSKLATIADPLIRRYHGATSKQPVKIGDHPKTIGTDRRAQVKSQA